MCKVLISAEYFEKVIVTVTNFVERAPSGYPTNKEVRSQGEWRGIDQYNQRILSVTF